MFINSRIMNKQIPTRFPRRCWSLTLGAFLCLGLASCSMPPVEIVTEPAGARVYVNGDLIGVSPRIVATPFAEAERVWIQVSLAGYEPQGNHYTAAELTGRPIVFKLHRQR